MEEVKRLAPKPDTLRRLFVNSGNQCAFPGCPNKLLNNKGDFIAQVCHIEAANEGGERFNPNMTNEQRRNYSNLVLLCYEHHIETNDEEEFPVERMVKIKEEHEDKFKSIIEDMSTSFVKDVTNSQSAKFPRTLDSINKVLKWDLNKEQLTGVLESMQGELSKLKEITPSSRSVFLKMLERSKDNVILLEEIQDVLNLSVKKMRKHIDILTKNGLIDEPDESEEYRGYTSEFTQIEGWPLWDDIKKYCEEKKIDLHSVIYDMEFDLLD